VASDHRPLSLSPASRCTALVFGRKQKPEGRAGFLKQFDEDLKDYEDKGKVTTGTPDGHRSATATSTGSGTAPTGAEPKPKNLQHEASKSGVGLAGLKLRAK